MKSATKLYKVIVTTLVSEHTSEREARAALAELPPQQGALGVVVGPKTTTLPKKSVAKKQRKGK